jgi:hypothetical protein
MEPERSLPCPQNPPLGPILSQSNPVRHIHKVYLNIILPPTPRSSLWAFKGQVKGKVVPVLFFLTEHHAMKAYWGVEV